MTGMRPTMRPTLANSGGHASRRRAGAGAGRSGAFGHDFGSRRLERSREGRYRRLGACHPSVHRPPRPAPSRCPRSATSSATCGGRGTTRPRTCSRAVDPEVWDAVGHDPVRLLGAVRPRAARRARPRTTPSSTCSRRPRERPRALPRPPTAGTTAGPATTRPARSPTSRPSTASPRCCRSTPAASASSPATTSRRPATSASRSSASACSTATATSTSRSRARAGSRRPTRSSTPTSCR